MPETDDLEIVPDVPRTVVARYPACFIAVERPPAPLAPSQLEGRAMTTEHRPLSEAELDEIESYVVSRSSITMSYRETILALIASNRALRAALRPFAKDMYGCHYCSYPTIEDGHDPDCPTVIARAALGEDP